MRFFAFALFAKDLCVAALKYTHFLGVCTFVHTLFLFGDDYMNSELNPTSLIMISSTILPILSVVEDFFSGSTSDTFWHNLLFAPLYFLGSALAVGGVLLIISIVISVWLENIEDNGRAKYVEIGVVLVIACVVYAAAKTYM